MHHTLGDSVSLFCWRAKLWGCHGVEIHPWQAPSICLTCPHSHSLPGNTPLANTADIRLRLTSDVQWYTKVEQSARTAIWVSFSGFAQIFGGLVAYGIFKGDKSHDYSIAGWKVVFVVFGRITIFLGVLVLILMPDSQANAWWMSRQNRVLAIERIRVNQQGIGNRKFKWYQFREALMDLLTWLIGFYAIAANIPNGGLTNFFAQLVVSFGFTPQESLLYGCPAGAVAIVSILAWEFLSRHLSYRILWGTFAMIVATLGAILIVALPLHHKVGRLVGYYLTTV